LKKTIIFTAFTVFIILVGLSYGEETTVYQEVYYDQKDAAGHFDKMAEALAHVEEGGTVYIAMPLDISLLGEKEIEIPKSVTIKGLDNKVNQINIQSTKVESVFVLEDDISFQLENLHISGYGNLVIKGASREITIKNCKFRNCTPIYVIGKKPEKILFESNEVTGGRVSLEAYSYGTEVVVRDSRFTSLDGHIYGFSVKNCKILMENNYFNGVSLSINNGIEASGLVQYNTFERDGRKILVREDNSNILFQNNRIYKDDNQVSYEKEVGTLDFSKNWWGSKDGPDTKIFHGSISYDNWALFEDFRRYAEDPYTITDIQDGYDYLDQAVDEDSWIYDMDKDQQISFLDLIAITRCVAE
jgi:hypothetical protein